MIEIKSVYGYVLYVARNASDVRSAVIEAVAAHANLRYADLRSADLGSANLRSADLGSANLGSANLSYANLRSANLSYANLGSANLRYADLGYADLRYADLGYADLRSADLGSADLRSADLRSADLGSANLGYAKNAELAIAMTRIIPAEGGYIAWKKLTGNCVAKLKIPSKAKRSHASGRKCRASEARVLAIFNIETGAEVPEAYSLRDHTFVYRVGETVKTRKPFSDDMWNECASGIHHFITRAEAENYSG